MKNLLLIFSITFLSISCHIMPGNNEGKGPMTSMAYSGEAFSGIESHNGLKVNITKGDSDQVIVHAPSDIISRIEVSRLSNEPMMKISVKSNSNISTNKVRVDVIMRELSRIKSSSASEIEVKSEFVSPEMIVESSSGSRISGNFKAKNAHVSSSSGSEINGHIEAVLLILSASSGSDIKIDGFVSQSQVSASSGSEINAKKLFIQDLESNASSGARVDIGATNKINAAASSGAEINVYTTKENREGTRTYESSGGSVHIEKANP